MSIQNISPANLAIIEKQRNQQTTNHVVEKTETKDNKKKIILTMAGLAAIGLATIGICALTKNHKRASQAGQNLLENLSKENESKVTDEAIQEAKEAAEELTKFKKQIANDLDNPRFGKDFQNYAVTPTVIDKNSVKEDLSAWIQKRKEAPSLASNGAYLNCPDNIGLEKIKPHNYTKTSDIFIQTREYNHGFTEKGRMVVDDNLEILHENSTTDFIDLARENSINGGYFDEYINYKLLQGHDENGKAYVLFQFKPERADKGKRPCNTIIMLRSKTSEFNQDQLDLIKAYEKNPKLSDGKMGHPFGLSFLIPEETSKNKTSELQFNKNMFLSLIYHFANQD